MGLAAVSYDSVPVLKSFADRKQITFPLLSDPESKIIRSFGILNETVEKSNPFFGVPHPGTYVLSPKGVVIAKYFEDDYKERDTASAILVRQFGLKTEASHSTAQGKQLSLSTSASTSTIATGAHVALVVDIDLKPGMHVYAPGVQGYLAIDWQQPDSDAAKALPVAYPAPKKLRLEAIDETVPVYLGQVRLVRDIAIASDAKVKPLLDADGQLTVQGTLKYQACDDKKCYLPDSIPLRWTFHYQQMDRQRVAPELQRKGLK
ncbi:MAG: redoxin domain-containing protein [Acidobacteriota bacterium]|nr:redoxin domain-containing protein [Acidobacteriota bacterium]